MTDTIEQSGIPTYYITDTAQVRFFNPDGSTFDVIYVGGTLTIEGSSPLVTTQYQDRCRSLLVGIESERRQAA